MILAQANPPEMLNGWLACLFYLAGGILVFLKIVEHFRGPRQLPPSGELNVRLEKLEMDLIAHRAHSEENHRTVLTTINERNRDGETRANEIHKRIDPLVGTAGEIKGALQAFSQSFDNFTKLMTSMKEQNK